MGNWKGQKQLHSLTEAPDRTEAADGIADKAQGAQVGAAKHK